MRNWLKRYQEEDAEAGFTLIELMVVVMIIAILIAIAVPTFLGARDKASDRAAEANLATARDAEAQFYADGQTYNPTTGAVSATTMAAQEPGIHWLAGVSVSNTGEVGIEVSTGFEALCLTAKSASGTTFSIVDVKNTIGSVAPGTYYQKVGITTCDDTAVSGTATQDGFK
jgi:type IV pilus assembly protein PilA